jgi:hypothetical protein
MWNAPESCVPLLFYMAEGTKNMAEGEEYNELGSEPISSLLCIPRSAHKSWDFADNVSIQTNSIFFMVI